MPPSVGVSRPSTSLAVVVLPQPDSPTTPRVCPLSMANETPSTARTVPPPPPKNPRRPGKNLVSPTASSTAITRLRPVGCGLPRRLRQASSVQSGQPQDPSPGVPPRGTDRTLPNNAGRKHSQAAARRGWGAGPQLQSAARDCLPYAGSSSAAPRYMDAPAH